MTPDEMLARLLYRDGLMLVVDKPAGFAGASRSQGRRCLEDYFDALRFGLPRPPALAHRLDRDTSGCLVLGRHRKALALLGKLFKQGKVGKCYWAVVEGGPETDEGRIDIPLAKRDETRGWWMKADSHGLPSASTWKVMGRGARPHLARARAADWAHPPIARPLRRDGMAGFRRQYIWHRTTHGRTGASSAFARSHRADFQEQTGRHGDGSCAGTHARETHIVRLEADERVGILRNFQAPSTFRTHPQRLAERTMFIGHYGPSFACKAAKPAIPLWVLFLAVQLVDIVWSILCLTGN